MIDSLTGLLDRAGVGHVLGLQAELAVRHESPLSVLFLELEEIDDEGICVVARALEQQLGPTGFAARWGDDAFVVVLPGAGKDQVHDVIGRLTAAIRDVHPHATSVGASCLHDDVEPEGGDIASRLVRAADRDRERARAQAEARHDQRRAYRLAVEGRATVNAQGRDASTSGIQDVSLGGVLLVGGPELEIGESVRAEICIEGAPTFTITGTVVRRGVDAHGAPCHAVRFRQTNPEAEDLIEDAMAVAVDQPVGTTVIVVDPVRASRRAASAVLRSAGVRVLTAETALRAVSILATEDRAVGTIVIASRLAQTSGGELAAYVAEAHPHVRRVVLDGPWTAEQLVTALEPG